ncbi:hypothetical protein ERJ75_001541400 [Trypanosoma vivax]|nr:hypothetical protein ERJ75_001541400 [Trypanosoma vivax]
MAHPLRPGRLSASWSWRVPSAVSPARHRRKRPHPVRPTRPSNATEGRVSIGVGFAKTRSAEGVRARKGCRAHDRRRLQQWRKPSDGLRACRQPRATRGTRRHSGGPSRVAWPNKDTARRAPVMKWCQTKAALSHRTRWQFRRARCGAAFGGPRGKDACGGGPSPRRVGGRTRARESGATAVRTGGCPPQCGSESRAPCVGKWDAEACEGQGRRHRGLHGDSALGGRRRERAQGGTSSELALNAMRHGGGG